MVKATLIIIGLVLCIWGLCELIHTVSLYAVCPKHRQKSCSVIWLKHRNAWEQLRYARLQMRWLGSAYADVIIAVTDSIPPQELALMRDCFIDGFVFCPSDAVTNVIVSITGEIHTDARFDKSATNRGDSGRC